MSASKIYLITGANSGVGKDAARQLALRDDTKKVYLACRTESKAIAAIDDLVKTASVDKNKLAYVHFDSSDPKEAIIGDVKAIDEAFIDGVILNAGGYSSENHGNAIPPNNVTSIAQVNLIGHVHLVDALLAAGKIGTIQKQRTTRVIYAGTEAARGLPLLGFKAPLLEKKTSVEEFTDILTGKAYEKGYDKNVAYAEIKGVAALYFGAGGYARAHPEVYVTTVSPGGTTGTNFKDSTAISPVERFVFGVLMSVMSVFGKFHSLSVGAKRYVDAVTGENGYEDYPSGTFVASEYGVTGPVSDQATDEKNGAAYGNEATQALAFEAIRKFA